MKETAFIQQNKEKWLAFEAFADGSLSVDAGELSDLYVSLVNDLAYAQTYYPKSITVAYLNQLCAAAFQKIYRTRRRDSNRLVDFYKVEVPMLMVEYRRYLLLAFIVFGLSVGIGVLSSIYNESFVRLILGDDYVNMTLDNIANGNPVAVYKSGSNWGSFLGITFNNLGVSLKAFIYGITAGLGTVYIALSNGVMLGAFQYMFVREGVFWDSVRGIWIHGSMEIFSIVISIMAGLILGAGILFPGTYSRVQSFRKSFEAGLKIFFSTVPFFIAAGFLEGFMTRYAIEMPAFASFGIILTTLALISYYYLVYPYRLMKKITPI
ncbi:MAG: stage II sporulation protein M [Saprospiraceae bacterium]|nr:stage II sporulation protein M [Saprospiraceae bacterium]